jgi:RNA polymerase sigma-70 factor (ECF subfamily)
VTDEIRSRMVELLPRLRRFAVALTGDLDQGDDLVQETCMRALSRVDQWQAGTRLDSWMYRIAQNLWLDRMRAKKVRGVQVDVEAAEALAGPNGRSVAESRLTLQAVGAAMAYLPEEQRVLIALVCIDGLSYKEAAEITQTPIGTVMSRLARARRELHARIDGHPQETIQRPPARNPRAQAPKQAPKPGTDV